MVDKIRIDATEFLQLPESNQLTQLIGGEVLVSPAPLLAHQRIVGAVYQLLLRLIPDGEVFLAPTDVYFDESNVLQPDVFWVSDQNQQCVPVDGRYLKGAPDLCVEVLSPGSARHDRTIKFLLYEKYGVREYWIADPATNTLEVWRLQDTQFVRQGGFAVKDQFDSVVLHGQAVQVNAIFI